MKVLIKITKELPQFSKINKDKRVVMVEFPNCISTTTNKPFKWMPTYKEMDDINEALLEIEDESWSELSDKVKEMGG
jgi:ribonucleotide reductase beta subunit family protein with ferritin-like domain|tara:strand:+ start:258 stop:488 length:231 start_codon:yes stop_codon:yes gene_type:complete